MPEPEVLERKPSPLAEPVVTETPAPSASAEPETPPEPSAEELKEKGFRGQQRAINELTKARRLAEAEAEFWRHKALGAPAPQAVETPKAKPNPADFETTEDYLDARDTWVREETMNTVKVELEKRDKSNEQRSEQETLAAEWGDIETTVQETHPDYEEVTAQAMDTLQASKESPATAAIAHAVQYSESGPQLLYYLGQHPEEIERLSRLHPTQAVIGLGRIEERLVGVEPGGERKPPPQTKAPRPTVPIRKASATATTADPNDPDDADKMPIEEWRRAREAKLRGR